MFKGGDLSRRPKVGQPSWQRCPISSTVGLCILQKRLELLSKLPSSFLFSKQSPLKRKISLEPKGAIRASSTLTFNAKCAQTEPLPPK